ncbi:uncharacterized protein LOC121630945 [Melanotaenia boesemani]|uniref:uncharacterized protein LOC121630945 n=1 Tax=Melanotaenia boesemani TaxID=1250792 RepID=UPI001C05D9C5|nr:uncharacterized protein LOC121630945 [Melanotaenia boesemani]
MLLSFVLLCFLSESIVKSTDTTKSSTELNSTTITTKATSTVENMPPLQVVATPDYPVAAGQRVHLLCSTPNVTAFVAWFWKHKENQTWSNVGSDRELLLTEPEQSGVYRCYAKNRLSQISESPDHTVYIVSVQATVEGKLGLAAFVLSLVGLISIISGLIWMGCQKRSATLTASSAPVKGAAGPAVASKGGFPQAESDGDVYINYTSTNHAYTNLDPTNVTEVNLYSTLS